MTKYHIKKDGTPGVCRATKNCPIGGVSSHFDTMEAAEQESQRRLAETYSHIDKDREIENMSIQIDELTALIKEGNLSVQDSDAARTKLFNLLKEVRGTTEYNPAKFAIYEAKEPDGGATFTLDGLRPTSGFCASPYPQYSKVFDSADDLSFIKLAEYVKDVKEKDKDVFAQDEVYLGLWNDPEDGKVYLDISKRYFSAEEARVACEEFDQIAFFDLNLFESVDVDRNAKSGQI